MPSVKFIEHNGTEHVVDGNNGDSLMVIATSNLVPGIDADCGGECSCAETEESMLDLNPDRETNSRLSCQIDMSDDLDGIVINLPEFQY